MQTDDGPGAESDPVPLYPGVVGAAGVIWIIFGGLQAVGTLIQLAALGADAGPGAKPNPMSPCCAGGIALAFAVIGYQTLTGKAKDTLGNAIGSIGFGLLQLLVAADAALAAGGVLAVNAVDPRAALATAVILLVSGGMLNAAGVLALTGRTRYRAWRRAVRKQPARDDD